MDRRKFLRASIGSTVLASGFPVTALKQTASISQSWDPYNHETSDGVLLTALRDEYRNDLFKDFLPFMDKYVIDHTYGGFMCDTDHTGKRVTDNKMSWFEGRGIWVYSFLYNNLAREDRYLEVARRSVKLILRIEPTGEDELWAKGLSKDGTPISSADGEIYGDLFIAEGLAEFSQAIQDRAYWDRAKQVVLKCVRLYDRPDYRPSIGQTYLGPEARPFPGARIQGVWMVLVRVATQMLKMHADADLEQIAARCVKAITKFHYNPEFGLINELLDHDLSRPVNEYAQLVYTGHAIETLWMLMAEAVRLDDTQLFHTLAGWFRRHVEVAWDDVYGGVFRNLQNVDRNIWLVDKVLWAQEEVLIGSLLVVEQTGEQWAKDLFRKMRSYVREKYPLKEHGSPLWMYASDRKATYEAFDALTRRVGNYHHPRHLMLNLLRIERMIGRGDRSI